MLGIQPKGLRINRTFLAEIDHGIGAVYAIERKSRRQFANGHLLAIVFGRPSQQTQKIDVADGKPMIAIGSDADHGTVLALGELCPIGSREAAASAQTADWRSRAFEDQQVLEGVGKVAALRTIWVMFRSMSSAQEAR